MGRHKLYVCDSGLAAHLARLSTDQLDPTQDPRPAGALVESFVLAELTRQTGWSREPVQLYHYRDRNGPEADIVLAHRDGRVAALEIKAGMSIGDNAFRTLRLLRDRLADRFVAGLVLYTGERALSFGDRLAAIPIEALWHLEAAA